MNDTILYNDIQFKIHSKDGKKLNKIDENKISDNTIKNN